MNNKYWKRSTTKTDSCRTQLPSWMNWSKKTARPSMISETKWNRRINVTSKKSSTWGTNWSKLFLPSKTPTTSTSSKHISSCFKTNFNYSKLNIRQIKWNLLKINLILQKIHLILHNLKLRPQNNQPDSVKMNHQWSVKTKTRFMNLSW